MKSTKPGPLAALDDACIVATWSAARRFEALTAERTRDAQPRHRAAWEKRAGNARKAVENLEREARRRGLALCEAPEPLPPAA